MKKSFIILIVVSIFTACSSTNRITEINDSKKDIKGFRLIQNPKAHSAEKNGKTLINQFFNMQTTFLFEERNNQNPAVTMEFQMKKSFPAEKTDSVMFLKLDNENIRIVSSKNTPIMAENSQTSANQNNNTGLVTTQFAIPENLWLSVANSKTIIYKLSSGKNGMEVKPDPEETAKVKEFFNRAMKRRLEIIPLVPPGKVKW